MMNGQHENHKNRSVASETSTGFIPAIRLINNLDGSCTFEKGKMPTLKPIKATVFWMSNETEEWEKNEHPAPRRQYVITIKGSIRFKVTDGTTFMIESGIILLAEDLKGAGHSWDMVKGEKWERLYIPMVENEGDLFIPDEDFM